MSMVSLGGLEHYGKDISPSRVNNHMATNKQKSTNYCNTWPPEGTKMKKGKSMASYTTDLTSPRESIYETRSTKPAVAQNYI